MSYFDIYLQALIAIMILMTLLWIVSVFIKNVSIVDLFWDFGFVITSFVTELINESFAFFIWTS